MSARKVIPLLGALLLCMSGCKKENTNPALDFKYAPVSPGGDMSLSKEYAGKSVVVYMWATWCGPCREFGPVLNKIADEYKSKDVKFLALASDEGAKVREYELKEPHRMDVALDTYRSGSIAMGSESLPTIVVLDRLHKPIWGSKGITEDTAAMLKTAIETSLE